ncbi:hypothetical protein QLX08_004003 [Tetragonisca angustula]|uniref:Uncharacterized protein n=1 Tax=Tetragonisca angustula TaxID=166442 RepID=A0AAW1A4F5_9HYME
MWRNLGKEKKHRGNDETGYKENKKGIRRGGTGGREEEDWIVERRMQGKEGTGEKETGKEKKNTERNTQEQEKNTKSCVRNGRK